MSLGMDFGKPRVLLVQPNGMWARPNDCADQWHRNDWHADLRCVDMAAPVERRTGSLVDGFNALWTMGLNLRDRGEVDYLAMVHSDVWASSWWITDLLSIMRQRRIPNLSAHVLIKSRDRQRTSTAIGRIDDPDSHRHLTLPMVDALPETITNDTPGLLGEGELLVCNTGCMVIDLRQDWCDDWIWPQTCHRKRDEETGQFVHTLRTEDWEWSRHLHRLGVRYGATRKVTTRHYGMDYWEIGPPPLPSFPIDEATNRAARKVAVAPGWVEAMGQPPTHEHAPCTWCNGLTKRRYPGGDVPVCDGCWNRKAEAEVEAHAGAQRYVTQLELDARKIARGLEPEARNHLAMASDELLSEA